MFCEQGTNVVETMSRLRKQIEILNEKLLRDKGLDLRVIFERQRIFLQQ